MLELHGHYGVLKLDWRCMCCGKHMRAGEPVFYRALGNGSYEPWHPKCVEEQRRMTLPDCPRAKV